ncbi:hypothetical protein [uncultured Desulfosarcina sp.]|uniref:hypothetical protein n=1 Tax=uncultured Desulfosarcina sp. TaxID=218289 RepID=UPI0029C7293C|nr:hypothetical protein [uncultured Desulfosarcina sp.]
MIIETTTNTVDIHNGNYSFWETLDNKEGAFKEWSELSLGVQERLQQIQAEVDVLVDEAKGLMGKTEERTFPQNRRSMF